MSGKPDPKPVKRYKASEEEWRAIHEHFRGKPLVCAGGVGYRPEDPRHCLHHIAFKKADSGDDLIVNLAPLRDIDHKVFHDRSPGWEKVAAAIRHYVMVDNDRRRYQEEKVGERFNKRYPPLANADQRFLDDRSKIWGSKWGQPEGKVEG